MKNFVEYLIESSKTYEFRVKIAGEVSDDHMSKLETRLEKFGLESISKPKRTPITTQPTGFGESVKNTEVNIFDVITNYPAAPHQIAAIIQELCSVPESHVAVINKNDPEEIAREEAASNKEGDYEPVLLKDYDDEKLDPTFGDEYNSNFLKELETRKYEFATKEKN